VFTRALLRLAPIAGAGLRRLRDAWRALAELAGVAFAVYGLYTAWRPLAFVAIGAAFLVASWRAAK
jgi:hypothetical protein